MNWCMSHCVCQYWLLFLKYRSIRLAPSSRNACEYIWTHTRLQVDHIFYTPEGVSPRPWTRTGKKRGLVTTPYFARSYGVEFCKSNKLLCHVGKVDLVDTLSHSSEAMQRRVLSSTVQKICIHFLTAFLCIINFHLEFTEYINTVMPLESQAPCHTVTSPRVRSGSSFAAHI